MLTRREMLKFGVLSGGTLFLPVGPFGGLLKGMERHSAEKAGRLRWSPRGAPFQTQLPIPPLLGQSIPPPELALELGTVDFDYFEQPMETASVEILPGLQTQVFGFNGLYPGPTLRGKKDRTTVIKRINNLPMGTVTHLHGSFVINASDGHPVTNQIQPGSSRVHVHPNKQEALTMWYHDHFLMNTGRNVYMGLAGMFILEDDFEADEGLNLPQGYGTYDIPLIIQDRLFNSDGSLHYPSRNENNTGDHGVQGDTILVNGAVQPRFSVANRKYRFRVLNGSNARQYELKLSSGQPLIQIGADGGLIPAPVNRGSVRIEPASRREFVIDFSSVPVGGSVTLKNLLGSGNVGEIMRFDVDRDETDDSSVPSTLRPLAEIKKADVSKRRRFNIGQSSGVWTFDGKPFDFDRVDAAAKWGATEIWEFTNSSGRFHPIHIHLVEFKILKVNGVKAKPGEIGPKDIINVPGGGSVQAIMRWPSESEFHDCHLPSKTLGSRDNLYIFHCHNLEHEDHDLMHQFTVGQV